MRQDIAGRFTAVSRRRSIVARLLTASSVALVLAIASGQVAQGREGGSPATRPGLQASADAPDQALRSEGSGTASTFTDQSASIHGGHDAVAIPIDVPGGLEHTRTGLWVICGGGICMACEGLKCGVRPY